MLPSTVNETLPSLAQRLVESLASHRRLLVAFSGGVDSSVVAAAACRAGLERVIAVTADSPSVPRWQLNVARQVAEQLGIEHLVIPTHETSLPEYKKNDLRRCFFCKQSLYVAIRAAAGQQFAGQLASFEIVSGTNADDLGDYRPGIEAGRMQGVLTPLAELSIGKQLVRELARYFGVPNHDLPASPCLASRVAYGIEVTADRLQRIEQAENVLRDHGFDEVRVRLHADELARIEVPRSQLGQLFALHAEMDLSSQFRLLGFRFVTVDMQGLQSGSMNRTLVSIGVPGPGEIGESEQEGVLS